MSGTRTDARLIDLPIDVVERLLQSRIVPFEAKVSAIEGWRKEVARASARDPRNFELLEMLYVASVYLTLSPRDQN